MQAKYFMPATQEMEFTAVRNHFKGQFKSHGTTVKKNWDWWVEHYWAQHLANKKEIMEKY